MLKNEKRNRRKALIITTFFYMSLLGGIVAYGNGVKVSEWLPTPVLEWLDIQPEEAVIANEDRA